MYLSLCEGRPPPRLICRLPDSCLATGGHCRSEAAVIISSSSHPYRHHIIITLGKPTREKSAVFFNIVQKASDPPPLSFEHYVVNFSEGMPTKVRKRLLQQLLTK